MKFRVFIKGAVVYKDGVKYVTPDADTCEVFDEKVISLLMSSTSVFPIEEATKEEEEKVANFSLGEEVTTTRKTRRNKQEK